MDDFKNRLKQALADNNMTQLRFAELLGMHRAMISQYISGRMVPSNNNKILAMARILNVNAAWLAGFDEPKDNLTLTSREIALLAEFSKLNDRGKDKAEEYIADLTEQPKYTAQPAQNKKMA